jgi:zinc transporter ZupT
LFSGATVFLKHNKLIHYTSHLLAFSASYLLSICFLHLLPELFEGGTTAGFYLLIGFFLQLVLDYFSGGIEHGHAHVNKKRLGTFPWLIFLSLCLHAFLETIPLEHLSHEHEHHSYLTGLVLHKIPISFVLTALLLGYGLKKWMVIAGLFAFSLIGAMGTLVGGMSGLLQDYAQQFLALSVGIILHLSTTILLETNEEHKIQWRKLLPMLLGMSLALLSSLH